MTTTHTTAAATFFGHLDASVLWDAFHPIALRNNPAEDGRREALFIALDFLGAAPVHIGAL